MPAMPRRFAMLLLIAFRDIVFHFARCRYFTIFDTLFSLYYFDMPTRFRASMPFIHLTPIIITLYLPLIFFFFFRFFHCCCRHAFDAAILFRFAAIPLFQHAADICFLFSRALFSITPLIFFLFSRAISLLICHMLPRVISRSHR